MRGSRKQILIADGRVRPPGRGSLGWGVYEGGRVLVIALFAAFGLSLLHTPAKTEAGTGINQTINYQARLLNTQGAVVPDGTYNVQFKIYKNGDGTTAGDTSGAPAGTLLWTESWQNSNSQGVTVKNGYFAVQLGTLCALGGGSCQGNTNTGADFNQSILWLSVNIGGTSTGASPTYDGEMLPMRPMAASPYAFNSNMLGGLTAAQFLQLAPNTVQTDSSTNSSIFVNKTGASGNVIQLQSGSTSDFIINNAGNAAFQQTALSQSAFEINNSSGNSVFSVDTSDSRVGINLGGTTVPSLTSAGLEINGALKVSSTAEDTFVTPVGSNVGTKINIPYFDPGNFGQVIAIGIPSTSATSARVLSVFDARSSSHQPSIAVFSPNEAQAFGLSWEGSNTTATLKSSSSTVAVQANSLNVLTVTNASGTGEVGINQPSPSRLLDVAANDTQTTAPMELLEQANTGDATIELKNSSINSSFYVGQDTSTAGTFAVNSSTAATSGISYVQSTNNAASASATNIAKAFSSNVTVGNMIVAMFTFVNASLPSFSCSDNLGNTYTVVDVHTDAATNTVGGICYAPVNTGGSDTVTATIAGGQSGTNRGLTLNEYHGLATSSPVDVSTGQSAASNSGSANGVSSSSATTTVNGDLIFGGVIDTSGTSTVMSPGTAFSERVASLTVPYIASQDLVQSTAGSTASLATFNDTDSYMALMAAFKPASTTLSDTFNNPVFSLSQSGIATFKNFNSSTAAFQIQNNAGTALFSADTTNNFISIGTGATASTAPTLLVLNGKSNGGDPTIAVEGAMYYNLSTHSYRCYSNTAWHSCASGIVYDQTGLPVGDTIANTTAATAFSESYTVPGNDCTNGRYYRISARGSYETAASGTNQLTMTLKLGSTTMLATPALTLTNGLAGNPSWSIDATFQCYNNNPNTSGFVNSQGNFFYATANNGTGATGVIMPNSNGNVNNFVTLNTTTTQAITLTAQWSVASSANTISMFQFTVEALGPS